MEDREGKGRERVGNRERGKDNEKRRKKRRKRKEGETEERGGKGVRNFISHHLATLIIM